MNFSKELEGWSEIMNGHNFHLSLNSNGRSIQIFFKLLKINIRFGSCEIGKLKSTAL